MPVHDFVLDPVVLSSFRKGDTGTVLDLGCGYGLFGYMLRLERDFKGTLIGVDAYPPYAKKLKEYAGAVYDSLVVADARHLPFRDGAVDTVLASEIIEHMPKGDGFRLIGEAERVGRKRVIVTTPRGFIPQERHNENDLEVHHSGWSERDFARHGYRIAYAGSVQMMIRRSKLSGVGSTINAVLGLMPDALRKRLPKYELVCFKEMDPRGKK